MPRYQVEVEVEVAELLKTISAGEEAAARLKSVRAQCQHDWSEVTYDPKIVNGYESPGDPIGTMGVDRRLPQWVPEQRSDRWSRTCAKCGLIEYTTQSTEKKTKVPVFS